MARRMVVMVVAALLAGCGGGPPKPETLTLAAPDGARLPLPARAMVFVAQSDLERTLTYDINQVSQQTTDIRDGEAMEQAARALVSKAFATTATNQPTLRPHVVLRVTGKAVWNYRASEFKVTCEISATDGIGALIGRFPGAYRSEPVLSLESSLAPVYAQCLREPLEHLLRTPEIAEMSRAGFPDPDLAATNAYLRSQGFVIPGAR